MLSDDLTRMAREAGLHLPYWFDDMDPANDPPAGWTMLSPCGPALERFARAVERAAYERAAQEREPATDAILAACKGTKERAAKACEALAFPEANSHWSDGFNTAIKRCAAAIRALGRQHD